MIHIDDSDQSPAYEDVIEILNYLLMLKYDDSDTHKRIAELLSTLAASHFERADNLCKIESHKGKRGPEQLNLIDKVIKVLNNA